MSKELPCKQLRCELIERLQKGVIGKYNKDAEVIRKEGTELVNYFTIKNIHPNDALVIMEFTKLAIQEVMVEFN